jgi:O-antigen ligase
MIIGTGPETFPYEFQKFRPPELNYSSEWDFVFNKPHNYYLELLTTIGAVGTLFYLLIVFKSMGSGDKFYVPGLVAFYVTNVFGWPTVTTALLFWLFLAGIEQDK